LENFSRRGFLLAAPAFIVATRLDFGVPLPAKEGYITAQDAVKWWWRTSAGLLIPRNRMQGKPPWINLDVVKVKRVNGKYLIVDN